MIEKRQENGPVKERNSKRECKADMKNSKRRLLALNLTERGGPICTKENPASPWGMRWEFAVFSQRELKKKIKLFPFTVILGQILVTGSKAYQILSSKLMNNIISPTLSPPWG